MFKENEDRQPQPGESDREQDARQPVGRIPIAVRPVKDEGAAAAAKILPFALRSRELVIGRNGLERARKKLLFILVTSDIAPNSIEEVGKQFRELPLISAYDSVFLEQEFKLRNCKVLGFKKSELSRRILELLLG